MFKRVLKTGKSKSVGDGTSNEAYRSELSVTDLARGPIIVVPPKETAYRPIGPGRNLGLTLLYQPAESSQAVVDIVFVHGLTGNAYGTWYHQKDRVHWPSNLLKGDIPDARIFAYGYDADVTSFWGHASRNRLGEHARNLLGDMARERGNTKTVRKGGVYSFRQRN